MKKTTENLIFLNVIFSICLVLATILASKLIIIGGKFILPSAVVVYGVTFLCTDIIGELWGREEANKTVWNGLLMQILATILIQLAIKLPIAPFMTEYQGIFEAVLKGTLRITLASLVAYMVSQTTDVMIFHKVKEINNGNHKWIRNNISTIISQFLDTAIFVIIGFYGNVPDLWVMIYSQWIIKVIIALCDTPFFYYFTKKNKSEEII